MLCLWTYVLFRDCSRPPGFKSSLNGVQVKIHHALEMGNKSECATTWTRLPRKASTIFVARSYFVKSDFAPFGDRRFHQLADDVKNRFKLRVILLFQTFQFAGQVGVRGH
jgi:hypothetical protein